MIGKKDDGEPAAKKKNDDWEEKDDGKPAAKGRLDQRLGVRLLDLGEYVEVLVETPASQTRARVSSVQRKLWLWEAVEGNCSGFNFCRQEGLATLYQTFISLHR